MPRFSALSSLFVGVGLVCACETSSGDDGSSGMSTTAETGDTGGTMHPESGVYLVEITKKTGMCRTEEEMASWKLTMPLPVEDGSWELTEEYSGEDLLRQEPYPCDLTGTKALCAMNKDRDYTAEMMGVTAVVTARRNWEIDWISTTELEGTVTVDLRCTGSSCPELAPDYLLTEWDCLTDAEFTGVLQ